MSTPTLCGECSGFVGFRGVARHRRGRGRSFAACGGCFSLLNPQKLDLRPNAWSPLAPSSWALQLSRRAGENSTALHLGDLGLGFVGKAVQVITLAHLSVRVLKRWPFGLDLSFVDLRVAVFDFRHGRREAL